MKLFTNKLGALSAIAALGAAGLFAQATLAPRHMQRHGMFGQKMASELKLTDDQKTQAKSIFQDARQSAQPIRQQLQQTRASLRSAVQSGNTDQIQQLSATQGSEVGQLTAIRSSAFAKLYKILTPEQQQKLAAMHQNARSHKRGGQNQ
jgi:periplasmic protein CpxP/Spy